MRDRETIERELFDAREDLELAVGDLKHVVEEKLDVKARVNHAVEEKKDELADALRSVKRRVVHEVRANPIVFAAIAATILAAAIGATVVYRRMHRTC
jgi:signal transduction histidine kinase